MIKVAILDDYQNAFQQIVEVENYKDKFNNLNIGPVLFYEHMHYYKEIMIGVEFSINVEIDGYSEDGRFFTLFQNFYDMNGNHLAHLDLAFGIMDTKLRKLISMPNESFEIFKEGPKSNTFSIITKEDLRKHGKLPENK